MTYVYKCRECNRRFQFEQRISEAPLSRCALCAANGTVFRVPQLPQVIYRGSGFHCNDYGTRFKVDTSAPEPGDG